ncbi:MAG: cytochrome d ubiquinol oxidase subunit II [Polyangiaceae bacterium]
MQMLWYWLVSIMIAVYATLDGFDFGAGMLHPFVAKTDQERRDVFGAIGPYWDANEVWLIAGGGSLYVAFPRVLSAGFSGLYLAMFLVLWTLVLRGISIEFRSHVEIDLWRSFWDGVFVVASSLMPVFLGAALGNIVRGVPLDREGHYNLPLFTSFGTANPVGILDWYTVLVGGFVTTTLAGHGAVFLAWKTDGGVFERCRRLVLPLWSVSAILGVVTTIATARVNPSIYANLPRAPIAWFGLTAFVGGIIVVFVAHFKARYALAFLGSSAFILGLLVATAATLFPVMLRSTLDPTWNLTAFNASASRTALEAGVKWWFAGIPLVVLYFALVFRLHRGKVRTREDGSGY